MKYLLLTISICILASCGGGGQTPSSLPRFTGLPLTDAQKAEVVRQINETNRIAMTKGLAVKPPSFYTVEVHPADSRCGQNSPWLVVESATDLYYDQGDYDLDPRPGFAAVCTPGRFIPPSTIWVTAESLPFDGARFESEHLVLYWGDRDWYTRTAHHGPDSQHPLLK